MRGGGGRVSGRWAEVEGGEGFGGGEGEIGERRCGDDVGLIKLEALEGV